MILVNIGKIDSLYSSGVDLSFQFRTFSPSQTILTLETLFQCHRIGQREKAAEEEEKENEGEKKERKGLTYYMEPQVA